jgi:thymidylate kinase
VLSLIAKPDGLSHLRLLQKASEKRQKECLFLTSKVIIFSGIDGSGKSAHARKLMHELEVGGKSVEYLWMRGRGRTFLSFPLLVLCRLLNITKVHTLENGVKISEYSFYKYAPLRLLWPWLQLIDSIIYTTVLIRLSLIHSYDLLIVDRSVVDTLVDVISDTHFPYGMDTLHRLFLFLLPKNSLVIILDTNEETALTRKRDILSRDYLSTRRRIYKSLAVSQNWQVVFTNGDFNSSHNFLSKIVRRWLSYDI